jgi:predicted CXXCH cytochrome family protein
MNKDRRLMMKAWLKRTTGWTPLIINHQSLFLCLALLLTVGLVPATARAQGDPDPNRPTNDQCLVCHAEPGLEMALPSNEALSLTIDASALDGSVHGLHASEEVRCVDCHNDLSGYPHADFPAPDYRTWQLQMSQVCGNCHEDQAREEQDSIHARLIASGKSEAAACADCHGSHDVQWADSENPEVDRMQMVDACGQCHSSIAGDYKQSIHGQEAAKGNEDAPTCSSCHPAHGILDPRSAEFRMKSPELCGGCHADKEMMDKYDISTDVFDTYVTDFHGSTVAIFGATEPGVVTNKAVCSDCHGAHLILPPTDENASVMSANLLETCQRCHPDANESFTKSWMGHYRPDWRHYPLVTAVQWFYYLVIPFTMAFFALFVSTDAFRTLKNRRKKKTHDGDSQQPGGEDHD